MVRCLIVDDEPLALEVLKRYISATSSLELAGAFISPSEAISFLSKNNVDLLFVDIQMPGINGLEFIHALPKKPTIIFTTAFRDYALDAFESQALDYLLKPFRYERFLQAVQKYHIRTLDRSIDKSESRIDDTFLYVKSDKEMLKLVLMDICYVEALKNYVRIRSIQNEIISYYTLSYIESKLPRETFLRIHKSYLVNLHRIDKYTAEFVQVAGKVLPIGKTFQLELTNQLNKRSI